MNDFDKHEIRSQVKAEGFGSWLLKRKTAGKWVGEFWCRITAATSEDTDDAREDIAAKIAELREEINALEPAGSVHGDDATADVEVKHLELVVQSWRAGLATSDEYDGREGVFMLLRKVYAGEGIEGEDLIGIGARPSPALKFAHAAVRRLHALLSAQVITLDQSIVVVVDGSSSSGVHSPR